ncbi:GNAT family N-acetyltransferase [Tenacibaculum sp.]|nr:GNAT family N-acetyltransferase [Tenacibaculum sp.]
MKLPNDENARHFGLFIDDEIASVISLFMENEEVQFREFATLVGFQGLGYGTILLKSIIDLVKKEGVKKL